MVIFSSNYNVTPKFAKNPCPRPMWRMPECSDCSENVPASVSASASDAANCPKFEQNQKTNLISPPRAGTGTDAGTGFSLHSPHRARTRARVFAAFATPLLESKFLPERRIIGRIECKIWNLPCSIQNLDGLHRCCCKNLIQRIIPHSC